MIQFGSITIVSRILGLAREILQARFLGVCALSDAFIAAFRLPNVLRRIFAEGALSAAFVPAFVSLKREQKDHTANGLMTLSFLFFEGIIFVLCIIVFLFPAFVLKLVTPGFSGEQISYAIPLLRILFPFIFFVSSSALLAGSLQSINHFFAPAFGPVLLNIVYVGSLIICLTYNQSVKFLAWGILFGGFLNFAMHLGLYFAYNFRFGEITDDVQKAFRRVIFKFLPCLFGVGVVELNLFIDNWFSSYLPDGLYTTLYYGNRFMNIPLGVFAIALSTVLLPHFSRLALYAPKRFNFYLLEVAKFISWIILPSMLFLMFISREIFTQMLQKNPEYIIPAGIVLICYSSGLLFFSINKILINMFYSLKDTWSPTIASIIATASNIIMNAIGIYFWGVYGIAASTSISGLILTIACIWYLQKKHNYQFYFRNYGYFLSKYLLHLTIAVTLFLWMYYKFYQLLTNTTWHTFFYAEFGYWLFTIPLFLLTMMFMFYTRRLLHINVYFLNK